MEIQSELLFSVSAVFAVQCRTLLCDYSPYSYSKNSIDTQKKLSLNLHSLSVSELLEYVRKGT